MFPFISSNLMKIAGISSKLCHHAPPLLRAFDLSNQALSLLGSCNLSDHRPLILTNSPSFPSHSFLPKNPTFGNFQSTASSVAGMPSDEWGHRHQPSRLDDVQTQNPVAEALSRLSSSIDSSATFSASGVSFLREISGNSSAAATVAVDKPLTMRSLSLVPACREMNGEADVCSTPHTTLEAAPPATALEEPSRHSDTCDNSVLSANESTRDAIMATLVPWTAPSPLPSSSPTPDTSEMALSVRGMPVMEDFLLKLEEERLRELAALTVRHQVSRFLFRKRIQSMISPMPLRQEVPTIKYQQWNQKLEAKGFQNGSLFYLRNRVEDKNQDDINEVLTEANMTVMEIQSSDSHVIAIEVPFDYFDGDDTA